MPRKTPSWPYRMTMPTLTSMTLPNHKQTSRSIKRNTSSTQQQHAHHLALTIWCPNYSRTPSLLSTNPHVLPGTREALAANTAQAMVIQHYLSYLCISSSTVTGDVDVDQHQKHILTPLTWVKEHSRPTTAANTVPLNEFHSNHEWSNREQLYHSKNQGAAIIHGA